MTIALNKKLERLPQSCMFESDEDVSAIYFLININLYYKLSEARNMLKLRCAFIMLLFRCRNTVKYTLSTYFGTQAEINLGVI